MPNEPTPTTDITTDEGNALFQAEPYLIRVQGNRDYLPVAARVKWFRQVMPLGRIKTTEVEVILDHLPPGARSQAQGYARFYAEVFDADGNLLATGTKTETASNFPDYAEKAETGAIGRALAGAGFGTPLDADLDEGRVVDTPRARVARGSGGATRRNSAPTGAGRTEAPSNAPTPEQRIRQKLAYLTQLARRIGFASLEEASAHYGWDYAVLQANEELMGVAHGVMTTAVNNAQANDVQGGE